MDKFEVLYKIYPFLKGINESTKGIIEKNIYFKELESGEYIKTYRESCAGFLFVLSGSIKVQRITDEGEETNIHNIEKGGLCHEALSCFYNLKSLNIEGVALQNSQIALLSSDIFMKYIINNPEFLMYAYKDLYNKFGNVVEFKEEKNHDTLETRIIKYLARKNSNIIYATQREIAFEIDSAREAVSRKLKGLEKMGYIRVERGKIHLLKKFDDIKI